MKRPCCGLILFSCLFFVSCQKEIDWGIGGGSSSTLLVKTVLKAGTDSTVTNYSYDAAGRLVEEKITGISQGQNLDNDLKIYRNNSGIITRTVQVAATLLLSGVDSVVTRYNYGTGTGRYTSSVFGISLFGFTLTDSAVYIFDAGGKITGDQHYQSLSGLPFQLSFKQEYSYSANGTSVVNLQQSSYDPVAGTYDLVSTFDLTYDSKTNPLRLNSGNEAIVLSRPSLFSGNNATQTQYSDPNDPANNIMITLVYTYNSGGKPATATSTQNPGTTVSNIAYFYQ